MKLVLLIGDAAVGKMTVGQELMKITDLRLFHNHMTIEPVIEIFGYYEGKTIKKLREVIFEEFSRSRNAGMIFTYMWAFDMKEDWEYVEHVSGIFQKKGAEVYYIELVAPQDVRLQRNVSKNRLKHKASKRDLEMSKERLINDSRNFRCVSHEGEIPYENYLRVDNTELSAKDTAKMIKEHFSL